MNKACGSQAYVSDFNLFLKTDVNADVVQVTHNGKKNEILNGIPDWVYEGKSCPFQLTAVLQSV